MRTAALAPRCATTTRPVRARRKEARPGELLDAALELFVEKGFAATRVEEVAHRAGVSKGTLFLYFDSKEDLFKAVVRKSLSGHFPLWNAQLDSYQGSSSDLLRLFYQIWWDQVGSTPSSGLTKLVMSEAGNFPDIATFYQREVIQPANTLIGRILQRGIDSGEFRALNLEYAQHSILSPLVYLVLRKHSPALWSGMDIHAFLKQHVETLLQGLCTSHPAPARPKGKAGT